MYPPLFSTDVLYRCGDHLDADRAYVTFFCTQSKTAIHQAAQPLSKFVRLEEWPVDIRMQSDSAMGRINAIVDTIERSLAFFSAVPRYVSELQQVLDETRTVRADAESNWTRINAWLPGPRATRHSEEITG